MYMQLLNMPLMLDIIQHNFLCNEETIVSSIRDVLHFMLSCLLWAMIGSS
jgi:hypothetical protein